MRDQIIQKIQTIVTKKSNITEDDVRSLMVLIGKLLETIPETKYLIIRLFRNWSAHNEITQSNTGLRILAEINDTLVSVKDIQDNFEIQKKLSDAIGFERLKKELLNLLQELNIDISLVSSNKKWVSFVLHLIEIILDVPIKFPSLTKLDKGKEKIYNQIAKNPIKKGAGIISAKIQWFDFLGEKRKSLIIEAEDTTKIVIPLVITIT